MVLRVFKSGEVIIDSNLVKESSLWPWWLLWSSLASIEALRCDQRIHNGRNPYIAWLINQLVKKRPQKNQKAGVETEHLEWEIDINYQRIVREKRVVGDGAQTKGSIQSSINWRIRQYWASNRIAQWSIWEQDARIVFKQ